MCSPQVKYSAVAKAGNFLRYITPGSGTYYAQADPAEPAEKEAFWGRIYERLLEIKKAQDPRNIIQSWQSVGWRGSLSDARFTCYTQAKVSRAHCIHHCR